jgi:hypothetical protein
MNTDHNSLKTTVWFRENESFSPENKQPVFKGFVNISRAQIEEILKQEPDEYGCVKLNIAAWLGTSDGTFKGTADLPKPKNNEEFKRKGETPVKKYR